jgi:hypothetical protein
MSNERAQPTEEQLKEAHRNGVLLWKEIQDIEHTKNAVPDGCKCSLCEAARSVADRARCPACHGALMAMCFKPESNLEMADENVFWPTCDCGWTGELVGFMAVRHWVQPWESIGVRDAGKTENPSSKTKEAP